MSNGHRRCLVFYLSARIIFPDKKELFGFFKARKIEKNLFFDIVFGSPPNESLLYHKL